MAGKRPLVRRACVWNETVSSMEKRARSETDSPDRASLRHVYQQVCIRLVQLASWDQGIADFTGISLGKAALPSPHPVGLDEIYHI